MPAVKVLQALDQAKVQWFHFKAIIIAGMGFFTDSYDLFCIGLLTKLLGRLYYTDLTSKKPGSIPIGPNSAVTAVALCGTLVGQLFFGWLGDQIGRKKAYGATLLIMIIAALGSGLSFGHTGTAVITTLCIMRFLLGFGIGGDYPLSATIMSEYANKKTRGAFIAAVFSMQGIGILAASAVTLLVSGCFMAAYDRPPYTVDRAGSTAPQADFIWRIIVMFGAIPTAATFYYRMKLPETARYTALVERNAKITAENMSKVLGTQFTDLDGATVGTGKAYGAYDNKSWKDRWGITSLATGWNLPRNTPPENQTYGWFLRHYGRWLLGTSLCWFFLDVAFYSQNLFQNDVFTIIGWLPPRQNMDAIEEVWRIARAQALVALWSTVPGYWFTVFTIDIIGRWWIQFGGFFFMTLFMAILAGDYDNLKNNNHAAFVALYSLTFFFANWGPNATTFVVPAEIFPAKFRSTGHGISAASGKAGAIIGAFGFLYASQNKDATLSAPYPAGIGLKNSLILLAVSNGLGLFCTFLVPEPNGKSLEEYEGDEGQGLELERAKDVESAPASV
jgi:PHS family inorganic phosphate transporter-like MFS transporter